MKRVIILIPVLTLGLSGAACGDDVEDPNSIDPEVNPWTDYDIPPPEGGLVGGTFVYPEKVCFPAEDFPDLPADATLEDGQLCVWDLFAGSVPEGMMFNDVLSCETPFTQGPSWFAKPTRKYESPMELLDDPEYVVELEWVEEQIEASGCGCCHGSDLQSGNTSGFDVSAPAVWTDTMTNAQLAMGAGMFEDHKWFGKLDPADNHGYDRTETLFPTTDPERMREFFTREFERRGGGEEDMVEGQAQFDALFGGLFKEPNECISPFEGIEDGKIVWNGDALRQIYVLEEDSLTPGFPLSLDRPEGTVWALYVNTEAEPIESGAVAIGEIPEGARQAVPETADAPELVPGTTYRLFGSTDFMGRRILNCTFTY
ncbi:hypothetical protein PPSIR1_01647 [Plesiocystis pacifica SIR-1]|uniref:Lipoprotein n=1 Tax=Plesiocystis pacifica SIR-1 TaxID=391625 RepID=A6G8I0_9BACT|nr:hypothetical protein [Plesiocystis pacifica]EDM77890.1 hypothetical protein PPSIR1_01647 [Plesiocystis pacifica SIR-1]